MRRQAIFWSCVVACAAMVSTVFTGCGGAECADGTVEIDGECRISEDLDCPEGEVYDEEARDCVVEIECGANTEFDEQQGLCVAPDPVDCGENAELDPNKNECFATDTACGENTAYSDDAGGCVPTDEICTEGTYFDDDTELCYPEGTCQPGDVVLDGMCASEMEERASEADVTADDLTDPMFGGEPEQLDVDDDEELDFTGVIGEPTDLDGDGVVNQQVDVFEFDVEAGDRYELTVRSLGLPNPAFLISASDAQVDGFERYSVDRPDNSTSREVVFPTDGTYRITVKPGAYQEDTAQPLGSNDWKYLGTVEKKDDIDSTSHDFDEEQLTGMLDEPEDNLVVVDDLSYRQGQVLHLEWTQRPDTTDVTVMAWDEQNGQFLGEFDGDDTTIDVPETEQLVLLPDWRSHAGVEAKDFRLSGEERFHLMPGADTETTFDAAQHDGASISFEAVSGGSAAVTVTDEDGEVVIQDSTDPDSAIELVALEGGEYTVEYTNESSSTLELFEPDAKVIEPTHEATFFATSGSEVTIQQSNASDDTIDLLVVNANSDEILVLEESFDQASTLEFTVDTDDDGDNNVYYYEFEPGDPVDDLDVDVEVGLLETLDSFTTAGDEMVGFYQTNDDDASVPFQVLEDTTDNEVFSGSLEDEEVAFHTADLFGDTGDFTVQWYNWGDAANLDFEAVSTDADDVTDGDFTLEDYQSVVISQQNNDNGVVYALVENDDTGELIFEGLLEDSEEFVYTTGAGSTDFTVKYYDFGFFSNVNFDIDEITPSPLDSFTTSDNHYRVDISQTNLDEQLLDLLLVHDNGDTEVLEEFSLDDDASQRFELDHYSGDFLVMWYDYGEIDEDDVNVESDVIPPVSGDDFTADQFDVVEITQSNGDEEDIDIFITDDDDEVVYTDSSISTDDTVVYVAPEADSYTVYWYDYGEISGDVTMEATVTTPEDSEIRNPEARDLIHVTQSNDDDETVGVTVIDDDTDELLSFEYLSPDDEMIYFVEESGPHKISWTNFENADNLDVDVDVVSGITDTTFTADQYDLVEISQSNDDDDDLRLVVVAESTDDVVFDQTLTTSDNVELLLPEDDDYDVLWYDYGTTNVDITVDTDDVDTKLAASFDANFGDFARIYREDSESSVGVMVISEDGTIIASEPQLSSDDWEVMEVFGTKDGDHDILMYSDSVDFDDVDLVYEHRESEVIDDLTETYTGENVQEEIYGPHDHYLIHADETATYEMTLAVTGGSGWGDLLVAQVPNDVVDNTGDVFSSSSETLEIDLEEGESYLLRVGNDMDWDWVFDYELTFNQL